MTAIGRLVLMLARLLEDDEREEIGHFLAESVHGIEAAEAASEEQASDEPDWSYLWHALLGASDHAHRILALLEFERIYFDVSAITESARELRSLINAAYELTCEVHARDGLVLEAGTTIEELWRQFALHRAALVDADLESVRRTPSPEAPGWTVDIDEHGGFVATITSEAADVAPWKFWGSAATAASAAHTLAWFFHDRPPKIVFDPPASLMPLASNVVDADRSPEGPSVAELLARRGTAYVDHVRAVQEARDALRRRAEDVEGFLAERAAGLNAADPQRLRHQKVLTALPSGDNRDHLGFANTVMWVATRLVVGTRNPVWGDFEGHRDETPLDIAAGLLGADDMDAFTLKLFTPKIDLMMAPGWAGPLFRVGSNGNHRVHTARMLELPWLAAAVRVEAFPPSWRIIDLLAMDPDGGTKIRSFEHRMRERTELVTGLLRRGVIDGDLTGERGETLRCRRLPAAWLLHRAEYATAVNAVYEDRYPGALAQLGIPPEAGTNPSAWQRWLAEA
ncbi:hypothetical protein [Amycolatopsis sp. cmx-4-68]|uniref:hypothetical protein n=1 Tax=Amycolatopsis sp. cmx-4-68 TaxID=2790938 RepID=UPI00397938D3